MPIEPENIVHGKTAGSPCPNCGTVLDGWTGVDGVKPNIGDISLCWYCGELGKFGPNFVLCKLTDEELIAIAGKPEITEAMKLYHKAKERYQDKGASA